jgi:hypothetical protein
VGLIARALEQEGVSTVCVVLNRDIAENVIPPRALHVHFPYGAPLGPAHHAETQEAVIKAALGVLVNAAEPGTIVEAGIEWPD